MRVAVLALLCVMPFGLTTGRLTNSPTPADLCCTSISSRIPDLWCEQVACDPEYVNAGLCKWTPCGTTPPTVPTTPTAEPTMPTALPTAEPTMPTALPTAEPTMPTALPTARPTARPTPVPTRARLTDGTIRSAVLKWCAGGNNQTQVEITYGPIANWDTSQVTSMSGLFRSQSSCNPEISNWPTGNVTDMSFMFAGASMFDQPIGDWDTAKVTTMQNMFFSAWAFNRPIGSWNTANVRTMTSMFEYAWGFNQGLSKWNTGAVTQWPNMFYGATKFNQPLCWTSRSSTYIFARTSCPPLTIEAFPTLSCWGAGTPTNCTAILPTLPPTPPKRNPTTAPTPK